MIRGGGSSGAELPLGARTSAPWSADILSALGSRTSRPLGGHLARRSDLFNLLRSLKKTPGKMPGARAGCPRTQCGRDVRAPEGRRRNHKGFTSTEITAGRYGTSACLIGSVQWSSSIL